MNRRHFLKTFGLTIGALAFVPKVFFETKEKNPVRLYFDARERARRELAQWMAEKVDEDIFNAIGSSPTKTIYLKQRRLAVKHNI